MTEAWELTDDKRAGRQLEAFRTKDFSTMTEEVKKVFTQTKLQLVHLPLASRVAKDGAGQYIERPVREFDTSDAQASAWAQLYRDLQVDRLLLEAEQAGILQQAYLLGSWLDERGRQRLVRFLPFHVAEVVWDDPMAEQVGDLRDAARVVLHLPVSRASLRDPESTPNVQTIVLTRHEAWASRPGSDGGRGLLHPSGRNPLGRLPIIGTRHETPDEGWFPRIAQDVLTCQIGLTLGVSDCLHTVRNQTHARMYATGPGAGSLPDDLPDGPTELWRFPQEVTLTPLQLNPAVEKYISVLNTMMVLLSNLRFLRPQSSDASIITGPALEIEHGGFLEERRRQETRCESNEEGLAELLRDVRNATQRRALKLAAPRLRVNWRYVRTRQNVLQEAQSLAVLTERGLWSEVEEVARAEGITTREAAKLIKRRLGEWRALIPTPTGKTPGLDKLAAPAGRPSDAGT